MDRLRRRERIKRIEGLGMQISHFVLYSRLGSESQAQNKWQQVGGAFLSFWLFSTSFICIPPFSTEFSLLPSPAGKTARWRPFADKVKLPSDQQSSFSTLGRPKLPFSILDETWRVTA